jgi:hypothetical protein
MTPAEAEARFIQLWNAGTETAETARQLGLKATTAQSRSRRLQERGLIQPRPRGGDYLSLRAKARQDGAPPPATPAAPMTPASPAPELRDIQQWTVWLSKALIDQLKAVAYERRIHPSQLLDELAWQALHDQSPSTP